MRTSRWFTFDANPHLTPAGRFNGFSVPNINCESLIQPARTGTGVLCKGALKAELQLPNRDRTGVVKPIVADDNSAVVSR
jgi:hypothetical protein